MAALRAALNRSVDEKQQPTHVVAIGVQDGWLKRVM
jgi:hypothetical protein